MNKLTYHAALAAALLVASVSASAAATVTYANPDKMTDVPRFQVDREGMESDFQEHFNKLSAKLPAGQELKVEILDIDLAGDVFPRVAVQNIRVLRGRADWPRMHLRYSIEENGKVLRSGEEHLSDSNYQSGFNRYGTDIYKHEKQMIDDWFRKKIVAAR